MARGIAYRKSRQNRLGMFLVSCVLFLLLIVVAFKSRELSVTRASYQQKEQALEEQIAAEEERALDIAEYEKYTQTKKYIEDVARDKLGLVYEGEILFKDEN